MPDHSLSDEPTPEIIDQHFSRLNEIWSNARRKWEKYDSYYFRTYSVWDNKDAHDIPGWLKPSRPTSIIDSAVDHQLASEPLFHRQPVGDSDPSKENADNVEKATNSIFSEAALEEMPSLTWKQQGKNLVHLGYSVHELGMDSRVMAHRREEPVREPGMDDTEWRALQRLHEHRTRTAQPFRTRTPHPARMLLDPWEKRPRVAVRHFRRYAQDIEDMVRARKAQKRKTGEFKVRDNKPFELMLVDEYWTEYWHAFMVVGVVNNKGSSGEYKYNSNQRRLLFVDRNFWGFVPYGHGFAGFGQEPTNSTKVDPSYFAVGLLESVMDDLKAQAQAVAARHHILMDASQTKIGTKMGSEELRDMLDQGNILGDLGGKEDVWRMDGPTIQRWMFETGNWYDADIEQGTYAKRLTGIRERGETTVGQTAILMDAAGRKFVGVSRQLEHIASVAASQVLQLIDLFDFDLRVRGNRINAAMLEHDYSITATFDLVNPVLQIQERQQAMNEVREGLMSTETYWATASRLEDASGERKRLLADFIRKNPLVHQAMALDVAKEIGVEELVLRAIEMAKGGSANGNGNQGANGLSKILGPDGNPLNLTLGQDGGAPQAAEELNNALTGDVVNPDRRGQNRAG